MNQLVPAASTPFADLELVPMRPEFGHATPLEQLFTALYRQRWIIAAAVGVALAIGVVLTFVLPKQYTAVAQVQLEQQTPQLLGDKDFDPQAPVQDANRFLQTQLDRVRSQSIAETVVDKLQLSKSPATLVALGIDPTDAPDAKIARQLAVYQLQGNVKALLGLNTRLAQVSFTTADPKLSANIVNAYVDALSTSNIEGKQQASERAKQYMVQQLAQAKDRLETSERNMLSYARRADLTTTIVPTSGNNNDRGGSLRAQQVGLMTDSLAQATSKRIEAQQRWVQVRGAAPLTLPEVQENQAIQNLVAQKAQLQASLEEDRQRHTDAYPSVRENAARIRELNGQIGSFAAVIKSSFEGKYLAAGQQERQIAHTVAQMQGAAMSERERSVGYNSLSREVETNKAFYDGLLQRFKEIAASAGALATNVTIVDRAWPPLKADGHLVRNLALASMAGLVLALFLGSMRERLHNVVRSSDDLLKHFNLPVLGVVPRVTSPTKIEDAIQDPHSAQSEAHYSIAVALQEAASGALPKTLLITSSTASEGKSTTALGLARSLTAMGQRVLLIDGDLRRQSSTKLVEDSTKPGLTDLLTGSAKPENSIEQTQANGFGIVRAGDVTSNPVTLLGDDRIKTVFNRLATKHDIVIIDGPPVKGLADAVLLARSVESVLVIVEANRTHMTELDMALSRLPRNNVIGGVITKFDPKKAGVRYGSYDYYAYQDND